MIKLAFCTDIHLDHIAANAVLPFIHSIAAAGPDVVVCTGDISNAILLHNHLGMIAKGLGEIPFYYVLGNHDFYGGSISDVRMLRSSDRRYLSLYSLVGKYVCINDNIAIVGHDGWYDGGYANWYASRIQMTDYKLISEFRSKSRLEMKSLINNLSNSAAECISISASAAAAVSKKVIIATHVPPFPKCSRGPDREQSNADWMPVMSSKAVGDAIIGVAEDHPDTKFTVLCGHTHTPWREVVTENVTCIVGNADSTGVSGYGHPTFEMLDM